MRHLTPTYAMLCDGTETVRSIWPNCDNFLATMPIQQAYHGCEPNLDDHGDPINSRNAALNDNAGIYACEAAAALNDILIDRYTYPDCELIIIQPAGDQYLVTIYVCRSD